MPSLRESIQRASLPAVERLNALPRFVPFVAILALMLAGLFVPGWGWVLLLLVVLFLLWTLYLAWPAMDSTQRLMRITIVLIAAAITVTQAFPRT
ncbi:MULTISPECIES: DUF6703 family protein [unclassified Phycicoccus]|uniref:DUF6703 family protein n=1 Tax=unclassified Phycicoccus TaxID=2637926 RepID=UPI0007035F79|nr:MULTISPECIES: DUF6703 family protein [unclassified Phycicoccus]KQU66356.1 hypothetical protein ASC58_14980 [Phycicoccus sp. Root101]KQZ87508.1 hypothetical protein ASD62_18215 [Phycicoccus sp. Root563]